MLQRIGSGTGSGYGQGTAEERRRRAIARATRDLTPRIREVKPSYTGRPCGPGIQVCDMEAVSCLDGSFGTCRSPIALPNSVSTGKRIKTVKRGASRRPTLDSPCRTPRDRDDGHVAICKG